MCMKYTEGFTPEIEINKKAKHYIELPDDAIEVMVQNDAVLPFPEMEVDDFFKDMRELAKKMTDTTEKPLKGE